MEIRINRDKMLMDCARAFAKRSTCTRGQAGVVIAINGRIVSSGYNGAPARMPHCDHTCNCGKYAAVMAKFQHATDCPEVSPCKVSVHGEANAIADAAKHGRSTDGAELFTTLSPCYGCSQLIINAGIVRVVYLVQYRVADGLHLLSSAKVKVQAV